MRDPIEQLSSRAQWLFKEPASDGLGLAVDAVSADAPPDDVRLAWVHRLAVTKSRSMIIALTPGEREDPGSGINPVNGQATMKLPRFQALFEELDSLPELLLLIPRQPAVIS